MSKKFSLDSLQLQEYQPNRYPFLMIDYVDEVLPGKYANGYKNLTMNEWFFPVHFPSGPNIGRHANQDYAPGDRTHSRLFKRDGWPGTQGT